MTALAQLQAILRRLFRLDESPELDFGVYRLLNLKREYLAGYLSEQLPQQVEAALDHAASETKVGEEAYLGVVFKYVSGTLGANALDADGNLKPELHDTVIGQEYLGLRQYTPSNKSAAELQEEIYDHLATFFSRYDCGGGDIVPRPRHVQGGAYALSHSGEDTLLHWPNRGQHYIKSGAYHPSIAIRLKGQRFVFRITDVRDIPRDNNKDAGRCLLPQISAISKTGDGDVLIPFTLRALSSKEKSRYGELAKGLAANGANGNGANGGKAQAGILAQALAELTEAASKKSALAPLLDSDADGQSAFLRHARRFVRRNNADFFIHRDLRGFLSTELDLYLKREALSMEELARLNGAAVAARMLTAKVARDLGMDIIEALAQWEDLQKALWEKKKFVLQTDYFIPLGKIPNLEEAKLLEAIADNKQQWAEWQQLGLSGEASPLFRNGSKRDKRIAWLKENPSLPVDTVHFPAEFKDQLLAQFADLDAATDGVLIHGENWQALNLIQELYRGQVKCVHIDPPYNTDTSGFLYKNGFRHSSWMAMMDGRISAALPLLAKDGIFQCHIDENEYERLSLLLDQTATLKAGTLVWDKRNPMLGGKGLATRHEYVVWRSLREVPLIGFSESLAAMQEQVQSLLETHGEINEAARNEYRSWLSANRRLSGGEKAYEYVDDAGGIYRLVAMGAPEMRSDSRFHLPLTHPVTGGECPAPPNGWSRAPETLAQLITGDLVVFGPDETTQPQKKVYLHDDAKKRISSVYRDGRSGKAYLDRMGLQFPYCHPVSLYERLFSFAPSDASIVDFFAGSGTTAQAVMNLNRQDGGQRDFILVEVGEHFNQVLVPRIKKAVFSPEWKKGKPIRPATVEELELGPSLVKYQRLESYEDALANIRFSVDGLDFGDGGPYDLQWDSHASPTWVLDSAMENPFDYRLELAASDNGNGGAAPVLCADLPETFAYLLGLRVQTRRVVMDGKRRYLVQRGLAAGKDTVVLWRDTAGWKPKDHQREQDFIAKAGLTEGAERVLMNGETSVKLAESLAPDFGDRMFAEGEGA